MMRCCFFEIPYGGLSMAHCPRGTVYILDVRENGPYVWTPVLTAREKFFVPMLDIGIYDLSLEELWRAYRRHITHHLRPFVKQGLGGSLSVFHRWRWEIGLVWSQRPLCNYRHQPSDRLAFKTDTPSWWQAEPDVAA